VYDTEFEIEAKLVEPPVELDLPTEEAPKP
jgi:hypothetical protein